MKRQAATRRRSRRDKWREILALVLKERTVKDKRRYVPGALDRLMAGLEPHLKKRLGENELMDVAENLIAIEEATGDYIRARR